MTEEIAKTPIEILAEELNLTVEEVHAQIIVSCEAIEAEAKSSAQ